VKQAFGVNESRIGENGYDERHLKNEMRLYDETEERIG